MAYQTFLAKKTELLEKRSAELTQQYEAISEQHDATLDAADKRVLKKKMSLLEKEIKEVEEERSKNSSEEQTYVTHGDEVITDNVVIEIKEVHSLSYDPLQSETAQSLGLPTFFK